MITFGISAIYVMFSFGNQYIYRDYFHTPMFGNELRHFALHVDLFELNDVPPVQAKRSIQVTDDDIEEYRGGLGNLTDHITFIQNEYDSRILEALAMDNQDSVDIYKTERDHKINDVRKVFIDDEFAKEQLEKERAQRQELFYAEREQFRPYFLKYRDQISYYFKSGSTGKTITNLKPSPGESAMDLMNDANMAYIAGYSLPDEQTLNEWIPGHEQIPDSRIPYQGALGISRDLSPSSSIMIAYATYQKEQIVVAVFVVAGLIALLAALFTGKRVLAHVRAEGRGPQAYNRMPVDIRMAFILLAGLGTVAILTYATDQLPFMDDSPVEYGWKLFYGLTLSAICILMTFMQVNWLAPRLKDWQTARHEWNLAFLSRAWRGAKALTARVSASLKEAFLNKSTGTQSFIVLFLVFLLGVSAIMMLVDPGFIALYAAVLVAFGLPLAMIIAKRIGYFNRIAMAAQALSDGNAGQELQVSGTTVLAQLAGNLNSLKRGVRTLQNEQAKSERLKTELITNVSHDLRTPLTSIITYVGLLKQEDVTEEDRSEYVDIIEKKSMRLKVLIDDLFEVSKMVSGNVELAREKVDLVQLLQQALAEYSSEINDSNLQFRVSAQEDPVFAHVDGQKLWRVFDNLIENILKYSLEGTRVYISIHATDQLATISFKNVSKYELSGNMEELLERFKRGDSSRHAEGSGLGLAIAKSIADLHEGQLTIDMDGDLFKATLSLNLIKELTQMQGNR